MTNPSLAYLLDDARQLYGRASYHLNNLTEKQQRELNKEVTLREYEYQLDINMNVLDKLQLMMVVLESLNRVTSQDAS